MHCGRPFHVHQSVVKKLSVTVVAWVFSSRSTYRDLAQSTTIIVVEEIDRQPSLMNDSRPTSFLIAD